MGTKNGGTILVVDPLPAPAKAASTQMMGVAAVPVEAMRASLEDLLKQCEAMFGQASKVLGAVKLEYVDLTLSVAVDGSIGLLGSKVGAEAKGGITVRMSFGSDKGA